jgi:hypothetical protein
VATKLVINDPETGEYVGKLTVPPGATHEQIVAAGAAVLGRWRDAKHRAVKPEPETPEGRLIVCGLCRNPIPEPELAAHVEAEQQRLLALEMADEARRGRR